MHVLKFNLLKKNPALGGRKFGGVFFNYVMKPKENKIRK